MICFSQNEQPQSQPLEGPANLHCLNVQYKYRFNSSQSDGLILAREEFNFSNFKFGLDGMLTAFLTTRKLVGYRFGRANQCDPDHGPHPRNRHCRARPKNTSPACRLAMRVAPSGSVLGQRSARKSSSDLPLIKLTSLHCSRHFL
jgi:hypothetical protein